MSVAWTDVSPRDGIQNLAGTVGTEVTVDASLDEIGRIVEAAGARVRVDLDALCAVASRLGEDLDMVLPGNLHRAGVWHPERLPAPAHA